MKYKILKGESFTAWALLIGKYKNGNDKAIAFTSLDGCYAGKAKIVTTERWYPQPVDCDESEIPEKVLKKLKSKYNSLHSKPNYEVISLHSKFH